MNDDDDATVFQTEEDKEKVLKEIPGELYNYDSEDDTTIRDV